MRARTAMAVMVLLAASVATVTAASAAPGAVTLPAASAPFRIGFVRATNAGPAFAAIFSAAADGSNPQQNTNASGTSDDLNPAYSPDGTKVAYATGNDAPGAVVHRAIVVANADGSGAHPLTAPDPASTDADPTWSPDGSMIAFDRLSPPSFDSGPSSHSIFVILVASDQVVGPLTADGWGNLTNPFWSPTDPGTIVATGTANGNFDTTIVRISLLVAGNSISIDSVTSLIAGESSCQPPPTQPPVIRSLRLAAELALLNTDPTISPDGGTVAYLSNFTARANICLVGIDGTNAREVPISNLSINPDSETTLADPAFSPDGSTLALAVYVGAGPTAGESIVAVTLNAPPATATSGTQTPWISNAAMPAFDVSSGPVSLTVAATPKPGYVGGNAVALTYKVRNQTNQALAAVTLRATLPATLPIASSSPSGCTAISCNLGDIPAGATAVATFNLTPKFAVSAVATGTITFTNGAGAPTTIAGQGPVVVIAPTLTPNPAVGPPGIVTLVSGLGFPPHATIRLTWDPGLTVPTKVKAKADGTFIVQMLVLPNDLIGGRILTAHSVSGTAFGDVPTPFLVEPGSPEPPRLTGRS